MMIPFCCFLLLAALSSITYAENNNCAMSTLAICEQDDHYQNCKNICEDLRLANCCKNFGVPNDCIHVCTYKVGPGKTTPCAESRCMGYMNIWNYCGNRRVSGTQCCQNRGIPEKCHEFCTLSRNYKLNELLERADCLNYAGEIIKCGRWANKQDKSDQQPITTPDFTPKYMGDTDAEKYAGLLQFVCIGHKGNS